jgi:NTP pyrophosphatase (non-canonical NTP hydrolase)
MELMEFNDYQRQARQTAMYPDLGQNLQYPTLGLCGEAGEVAEKVKKIMRDRGGVCTEEDRLAIARELGDCLWYVANLATELGWDLSAIAQQNLDKLRDRQARNQLHGSGDHR